MSGARSSGASAVTHESAQHLRERVAKYGLALTVVNVVLVSIEIGGWLFAPNDQIAANLTLTFASMLAFLGMWLWCRRPSATHASVRRAEAIGVLIGGGAYSLLVLAIPISAEPQWIVNATLGYVLLTHAAFVPGSARRTLFLGVTLGAPFIAALYYVHLGWEDHLHRPPALEMPVTSGEDVALAISIWGAAWWSITVGIAAAIAHVIHGLRAEARHAKRLGQYTLEEKIGEGGMGMVYRAEHALLARQTALKLLPPERNAAEDITRFEREVQRTAALTHPNTVTVYDFGHTADGVFYYAMELLDGASLDRVVKLDGPQAAGRVIHLLEQVLGALTEAHAAGLIHRDIKPSNIMLVTQGGVLDRAKVLDFGLVKEVGEEEGAAALTQEGRLVGTPMYMAPEAIRDPDSIDERTDLYAIGAVAYYLLTGTHVFEARTIVEVCAKHLSDEPEPPSKRLGRAVPEDLEELVLACLQKDKEHRPIGAAVLREQLLACNDAGTWSSQNAVDWWGEYEDALTTQQPSDEQKSMVMQPDK